MDKPKPLSRKQLEEKVLELTRKHDNEQRWRRDADTKRDEALGAVAELTRQINNLESKVGFQHILEERIASLNEDLHRCLGWIAAKEGKPPIEPKAEPPTDRFYRESFR